MYQKGSMTIYFSMLLVILISLLVTALYSVQLAGARVQAVHAADQGMYSLFSRYDTELLDRYHLFFIDGTFATGELQTGMLCAFLEQDIENVLDTDNGLTDGLALDDMAVTGYTLAADCDGNAVKVQAVSYMESVLGVQAVKTLLSKVQSQKTTVSTQESSTSDVDENSLLNLYQSIKSAGEKNAEQEAETDDEETTESETIVPDGYVNPIESLLAAKNSAMLALLVPSGESLSTVSVQADSMLSGRTAEEGTGTPACESCESVTDELLFNEYILEHFGCFTETKDSGGLVYQIEYILVGADSDQENLEGTAERLLMIREAANYLFLKNSQEKHAEIKAAAVILAAALSNPAAASSLEKILMFCWAFGESILDVRTLLSGGNVPLTKSSSTWQLSLSQLPNVLNGSSQSVGGASDGLDYQGYLRILLALRNSDKKQMLMLDMLESGVQAVEGKESFQLDCCVYSLDAEFTFETEGGVVYTAARSYGYDMGS